MPRFEKPTGEELEEIKLFIEGAEVIDVVSDDIRQLVEKKALIAIEAAQQDRRSERPQISSAYPATPATTTKSHKAED
jgi:hypothetical protein